MKHAIAYRNGEYVPAEQLVVQPQDMGFMWGVTVAEQLRTFGGKLFEPDPHFQRLAASLNVIGIDDVDVSELHAAAEYVVSQNHALLTAGDDLGVTVYVTPGMSPTYDPNAARVSNVGIHTYRLPFSLWATKYQSGQHCEVVSVPQINVACWPRELKCRSRMHYYLADREARQTNVAARAILLDAAGNVNEASTANVLAYFEDEGLVSPPLDQILPGVSLRFVERLAKQFGCNFTWRNLTPDEMAQADEILLTSTPFCILPVGQLGSRTLRQRHCFHWLMKAWSKDVGVDIEAQAKRFV